MNIDIAGYVTVPIASVLLFFCCIIHSLCTIKVESNPNQAKKESAVQLSLTVLIGPSDVVLNKPIKVFIPHCASTTDNTVWKLKV